MGKKDIEPRQEVRLGSVGEKGFSHMTTLPKVTGVHETYCGNHLAVDTYARHYAVYL